MAFPPSLTTIELTADFRALVGGVGLEADVQISSPSPLISNGDGVIVPRTDEWRRTVGGRLSVVLPATDDPDWLPNGWDYLVRATFDNGTRMAWLIKLAQASPGGKCDLARFGVEVPYPKSTGPFTVMYPSAPGGGGGGGVVSVNGRVGAVTLTKSDLGLALVDNTSDAAKPVSTAQQTALDAKAPTASPTFTGTVAGISKAMVGLGSVDNTADTAKPISTAQQAALDAKAPTASPTFTGTVGGVTKAMVGLGSVDNTADTAKPVSAAQQTALDGKASTASLNTHATDTTNPHAVTKAQVGLGSADNTSDAAKPVSTAQQAALDAKAPTASPTFTGTVAGVSKAMVGLGSVDNTSDTAKPVSTAQQAALDAKLDKAGYGSMWLPADHGLIAWAYEVENATLGTTLGLGILTLIKVKLPVAQTITNVAAHIATAGATLTAGQNFAGLFDSAGNRLGVTGDQSGAWTSAGPKIMALTAVVANAAAGVYYVGLLTNGTTAPAFSRSVGGSSTTVANLGLTGAGSRFSTNGSGLTAMPASFSPAASSGAVAAFWAGLS